EAAAADCASLEASAPESAEALGCRGALRLARGEFNDALIDLVPAAAVDDWRGLLALAALLAGQLDDAKVIYGSVTSSAPYLKLVALADLDFGLRLHPERAADDDIGAAARSVRSLLAEPAPQLS